MPLSPVSSTVDAGLAATFCSSALTSVDRAALADDAIEAVRLRLARAQRAHLAAQPRRLERLLDEQRDLVEVERLVRVVIRAVLHRLDGGVDARVRGQQDDQRVGVALLDLLEHRQAVAIRQLVIEQDEIDALARARSSASAAVAASTHAVAFLRQAVGQRPANQLLVVDDEDGRRLHVELYYCVFRPEVFRRLATTACPTSLAMSSMSKGLFTTRKAPRSNASPHDLRACEGRHENHGGARGEGTNRHQERQVVRVWQVEVQQDDVDRVRCLTHDRQRLGGI